MTNTHNLLRNETSPYLLQHADNPVNWHPWNQASLDLAASLNKPILLSIGYSACHWCHVMARESFEDKATADLMNELFINIKVDREERPDLDKIYQSAHSLLTSHSGGWPLTVFLLPQNQMPFFAGTYFPDQERDNMPSFQDIMHLVTDAFIHKQSEIKHQEQSIGDAFKNLCHYTPSKNTLNSLPLDLARKQLASLFDKATGGFSGAPKFPHPEMLERCLRHYLFLKQQDKLDDTSLNMALFTLDKMTIGGFRDQIGGGFFRYSTDKTWTIPHFEKMLYDNAQLLSVYTHAYLIKPTQTYLHTITSTADWVIREMQTVDGGYCSALDADTEKTEGRVYGWTPLDIKNILSANEYLIFEKKYQLNAAANFEGHWHMHSDRTNEELSQQLNINLEDVNLLLNSSNHKLLIERNTRTQPGQDSKILCSWNALMIRGMCIAGRHTQKPEYIHSAQQAADFIYKNLWHNKRLLVSYKDKPTKLNAYLDDYAYLLQALLELLQCEWQLHYFNWAIEIADSMLDFFEDKEHGGFYFTSHDHEQLIYRSKTFADDAMPNSNGIAASALLQIGLLSGQTKYLNSAEKTLLCSHDALNEQAITHCSLLHALELHLKPCVIIILRGDDNNIRKWQEFVNKHYIPNLNCYAIQSNSSMPDALKDKKNIGNICAYICEDSQCLPVLTNFNDFIHCINNMTHHEKT